jgi:hypothetical protein
VLIATAHSLGGSLPGQSRTSPPRKSGKGLLKGGGKKKGPAQRTSSYAGVPEYEHFKSAEKELKEFLKTNNVTLKVAETTEGLASQPAITKFHQARSAWFCGKVNLPPNLYHQNDGKEKKAKA